MNVSSKFLGISLIVAALVLVNGYLLLKNNNIILKSYYVNNLQYAQKNVQQEELTKSAAVVSSMEHFIATPVDSIEEVFVVKGQTITSLESLATYKSEQAESARAELDNKLYAYENELTELERILSSLRKEDNYPNTSTSTDGSTFGEDFWNIDLTIELGIEQHTPTAEGEAIIQRHIAETTREIDILDSQIDALNEENALTTPIDGIVADIVLEGDMITFVIQSTTKKLVTYVTKEEWLKVEAMQAASFTIFEGDEEREQRIDATVTAKQQIPAIQSLGYEELVKRTDLAKDDLVYEVSLEPVDSLDTTPLGEIVVVTIITNEAYDSYETYSDWIVEYEVEDVGTKHVYTLGLDGRTRLTPIEELFEHETVIHRERVEIVEEDMLLEEPIVEIVEETPTPRIQNVELAKKEEEEATESEEQEISEATVFNAPLETTAMILDGSEKNIYAPTYRPFPLEKFSRPAVGPFSWKDAIRYMLPQ